VVQHYDQAFYAVCVYYVVVVVDHEARLLAQVGQMGRAGLVEDVGQLLQQLG
jgi:hypothetical protein